MVETLRAHTQMILHQYFLNDCERPLGESGEEKVGEKRGRLQSMIQRLNRFDFDPPVGFLKLMSEARNYSYPQFELRRAKNKGVATNCLRSAFGKYMSGPTWASLPPGRKFNLQESKLEVSDLYLVQVRGDQRCSHLRFNQFLGVVVELPFGTLRDLRVFLEFHNYNILKHAFINNQIWDSPKPVSSMPTYVLVGNKEQRTYPGDSVVNIPIPFFNQHRPGNQSFVERGYPYVNYIVHETLDNFAQLDSEYIDLGLVVFLHGHLDRTIKKGLQDQSDKLRKLTKDLTASNDKLAEEIESFQNTITEIQELAHDLPEIEMMGKRLTQKYTSPKPSLPSVFQIVNEDNKEFLQYSVEAVVNGAKVLQDLFIVLFEKRSEQYRSRMENMVKILSGFGVVVVAQTIVPRDDALSFFKGLGLSTSITAHANYFYSWTLLGLGLIAVLLAWSLFGSSPREQGWRTAILLIAASMPIFILFVLWFAP